MPLDNGYLPEYRPLAQPSDPANDDSEQINQAAIAQFQLWRQDPLSFARDVFHFRPSNQQTKFLKELGKIVSAKCLVDEGHQDTMTEEQKQYARKRGISIRSGKGTGKDACVSIVVWWFLFCFNESKTFLVAPSADNLKSNLIAEMSKWMTRRIDGEPACLITSELELMSMGARMRNASPEQQKNWFVAGQTAGPNMPADKQLEVFHGKHSRYMMFVMDEASGIPDPVFQPLDTTLTDPVNFIILLWNPTRRSGFAYDTHFGNERQFWIPLHWSAEESDLITPDQIEYLRTKYGVESSEYRVSVLGEPPASDQDSLIPYEWAMDAVNLELVEDPNSLDPVVFGVDVARQGNDSSVILVRQGPFVHEIKELNKLDTIELARWVSAMAADWEPQAIYIDAAGIGIGVYDELKHQGIPNVYPVNVGTSPRSSKFTRLRDELWWEMRQRFQSSAISLQKLADPHQLVAEVSGIKYTVNDKGKIKVESKLEMRKRNMPSPNHGDALMLTMYASDKALSASHRLDLAEQDRERRHAQGSRRQKERAWQYKRNWMGV